MSSDVPPITVGQFRFSRRIANLYKQFVAFDGITRVMAELEEALELLDHDSRNQPGDR